MKFEFEDGPNKVINDLIDLSLNGNYVFRGYNIQDQMLPGLIRKDKGNRNAQTSISPDLIIKKRYRYEKDCLNKFLKYGSRFFKANSAIELLSNAQHYGLHTRLLDFTYNPLIALRFALYDEKKEHGNEAKDRDYYYIRYADLNSQIYVSELTDLGEIRDGGLINESVNTKLFAKLAALENVFNEDSPTSPIIDEYIEGLETCIITEYDYENIRTKIKNKALVFIDPNQSNDRVVMQQGLFMIPYTLSEDTYWDLINNNTTEIQIHKDLRDDLIKILDKLGYNAYRLMPDLASVCQEIIRNMI